ncbi:hypothetical protein GJU43_10710 [Flavobacterium sp. LC2016-23]|uniref:hypothetical protein n=1 Tax=Flavobacterium sp. LC2016-23 TaxID=2666330 RepID=UPI0012AFC094|nr:hypothetical protein [Flavobacterium sp. LC2016-23]MRX39746.1 hypothetical protein [Flavobacterium sp. LC2016-23]
MRIRKMSFADIENTMCKEEMKSIMGGSGTVGSGGSFIGGSLEYGGTNPRGFDTNYWASSAGWAPNNFDNYWGSSSSGTGKGLAPNNYTKGWTQTSNGITTNDPAIIKRIVDYLDWERVILKNEPTITQINNFVNMDYLTGGHGRLSDGSILGQSMSINHDPYGEFKTIESLSRVFQNFGDSLTVGGAALSTTGVGAIVGVPMMEIGGKISNIGTIAEFYLDLKSDKPVDWTKWIVKGALEAVPGGYEMLFSKRAGVVGFDQALVEIYAVASDRWIDYMRLRQQ